MRKHGSDDKLIRRDVVLARASSVTPVVRIGRADALAQEDSPAGERIDIGPALKKSRVSKLYGQEYPVQFRNQGAFEAWMQAPKEQGLSISHVSQTPSARLICERYAKHCIDHHKKQNHRISSRNSARWRDGWTWRLLY